MEAPNPARDNTTICSDCVNLIRSPIAKHYQSFITPDMRISKLPYGVNRNTCDGAEKVLYPSPPKKTAMYALLIEMLALADGSAGHSRTARIHCRTIIADLSG
jgi:hypothetical protein